MQNKIDFFLKVSPQVSSQTLSPMGGTMTWIGQTLSHRQKFPNSSNSYLRSFPVKQFLTLELTLEFLTLELTLKFLTLELTQEFLNLEFLTLEFLTLELDKNVTLSSFQEKHMQLLRLAVLNSSSFRSVTLIRYKLLFY